MNPRSCAFLALVAVSFSTLVACSTAPPPVPTSVCMGPESPDDLEDFIDRDIVRHPDSACTSGDPRYAFSLVSGPIPEIGAEFGDSDALVVYRDRQRTRLRSLAPRTSSSSAPTSAVRPSQSASPAPRSSAPAPAPTRAPAVTRAPAPAATVAPPAPRRTTCTGTGSKRRCVTR